MSQKRRSNKRLSEDELREVEEFVYSKNIEEDKFLKSMSVNYKCKTENQGKLREAIRNKVMTIVSGLPGTGKTFIACAEALKMIKTKPKYKKILLVKSVVQLKGEELGHLPGDIQEKFDPYMGSFVDNFEKIIGESLTRKLRELGLINIQPLAFVRGRSIDNTIIIVDEAQNISLDNMRTLMTRIGDNSKKDSSLEVIIERFNNIEDFGCVELRDPNDVVRNPIIKTIEDVFDGMENPIKRNKVLLNG
jgi:phosphate starvation-inducible PhoH-like protein